MEQNLSQTLWNKGTCRIEIRDRLTDTRIHYDRTQLVLLETDWVGPEKSCHILSATWQMTCHEANHSENNPTNGQIVQTYGTQINKFGNNFKVIE